MHTFCVFFYLLGWFKNRFLFILYYCIFDLYKIIIIYKFI